MAEFQRDACADVLPVNVGVGRGDGRQRLNKLKALARYRASFPGLARMAAEQRPDVIYSSQQLWDCAAATWVSQRLMRPHVIHLHYNIGPWLSTGFTKNARSLSFARKVLGLADPLQRLKRCAHVIAISDYIRADAIRNGTVPERVSTCRNSVEIPPLLPEAERCAVRAELGIPPGAPVIGIVGRFDLDKGHYDTLEAFARIAGKYPDVRLVVVGDGWLRGSFESLATERGVGERVVCTGWREDVPRLLGAMDIFSHPSRREPFGLAMAEASAASLPVIAYAEGGACEIVSDGETGLLAPAGDVLVLAECYSQLLSDLVMAKKFGRSGRARMAEDFRPEDSASAFVDILRSCI